MWTSENRGQYDRDKLRYPSDVTETPWRYPSRVDPLDGQKTLFRHINFADGL